MLPKKQKFSSKDFSNKNLFKNSKRIVVEYGFFIVLNIQSPQGLYKKSIVLSKKNFKTAVLRNKYKRLFYNTVLELQKEDNLIKEKSFVFYPKKTFTKEQLSKSLGVL